MYGMKRPLTYYGTIPNILGYQAFQEAICSPAMDELELSRFAQNSLQRIGIKTVFTKELKKTVPVCYNLPKH